MSAIGIDLGATNVRVALGDKEGTILQKQSERINLKNGRMGISNQIIRMITAFNVDDHDLEGIGIGSLGPLDIERGIILVASNFPFNNIPIREPIAEAFDVPIRVFNDCSVAVLGEKLFGLGRGRDHIAYITISSGIGCGAYENGRLILGKDGNASEMGHTVIDISGALKCGCGKRGHWEAYCSGNNMPHFVKLWISETHSQTDFKKSRLAELSSNNIANITAKMVYDTAKGGDTMCLKITESLGRLNAIGIANVIAAYDPELITLGGSVTLNNRALVLEPITRFIKELSINRLPEIDVTPLGHDIVLKGALALNFINI